MRSLQAGGDPRRAESRPPERRGTGTSRGPRARSSRCWSPSGRGPHHECRRRRRRRSCRRGAPSARCGRRSPSGPRASSPNARRRRASRSGSGHSPGKGPRQRRPSGRRPGARSSRRPGRRRSRRQPGRALVEESWSDTAQDHRRHTSPGQPRPGRSTRSSRCTTSRSYAAPSSRRSTAEVLPTSEGISSASKLTSPAPRQLRRARPGRPGRRPRRSRSSRSVRPPATTRGAR